MPQISSDTGIRFFPTEPARDPETGHAFLESVYLVRSSNSPDQTPRFAFDARTYPNVASVLDHLTGPLRTTLRDQSGNEFDPLPVSLTVHHGFTLAGVIAEDDRTADLLVANFETRRPSVRRIA